MQISIAAFPDVSSFAGRGVTHVVSIGDPELEVPDFRPFYGSDCYLRSVLRLHFHDIDGTEGQPGSRAASLAQRGIMHPRYPQDDDIDRLVQFARSVPEESHVLFHCLGGMYRSPTAAWIFLLAGQVASVTGRSGARADSPEKAWQKVIAVRPCASFNLLMVKIAENRLPCQGLLAHAEAWAKKFDL